MDFTFTISGASLEQRSIHSDGSSFISLLNQCVTPRGLEILLANLRVEKLLCARRTYVLSDSVSVQPGMMDTSPYVFVGS